MNTRSRDSRRCADRGSVAVELVLFAPVMLLLIFLGATAERVTSTQIGLDAAAHAAARDATLQRDAATAATAAEATAQAMVPDRCHSYAIEVDTGGLEPGGAVTVTLTCQVDSLVNGVGDITVTATSAAPVDQWRSGSDA